MSEHLLLHQVLCFSRMMAIYGAVLKREQDKLIEEQRGSFCKSRARKIAEIDVELRDLDDCVRFISTHCASDLGGHMKQEFKNNLYRESNKQWEAIRKNGSTIP